MNKSELIEHIAKNADISKAAATRAIEATIGAIKTTLRKGGAARPSGTWRAGVPRAALKTSRRRATSSTC